MKPVLSRGITFLADKPKAHASIRAAADSGGYISSAGPFNTCDAAHSLVRVAAQSCTQALHRGLSSCSCRGVIPPVGDIPSSWPRGGVGKWRVV